MLIRSILSFVIVALIFSACNPNKSAKILSDRDTAFDILTLNREGVVEYDIRTIKEVAVDPLNRKKVLAEVYIKYPDLNKTDNKLNKAVKGYISNYIEGILKENMNEEDTGKARNMISASKTFVRSCKSSILKLREEDPGYEDVWFCDITGNIEMQTGNYITLRFKYNCYTGGAHGNYGENYATFNLKTARKLEWNDIISDKEKFLILAEKRFKLVNGMATSVKLTEENGFFFEQNRFSLSDNFGLTSDGVVMYYAPNEVSPFSFGATSLLFKYYELMDYIQPSLFAEDH